MQTTDRQVRLEAMWALCNYLYIVSDEIRAKFVFFHEIYAALNDVIDCTVMKVVGIGLKVTQLMFQVLEGLGGAVADVAQEVGMVTTLHRLMVCCVTGVGDD